MKKNKFLTFFFSKYFPQYLSKNFFAVYSKGHNEVKKILSQSNAIPKIFVLNHSNWWDGVLIPYLDLSFFQTNGYCLMEKKQLDKNKFFGKIGAIEIVRENSFQSIKSLKTCIEILKSQNTNLYIFPQGKIEENGTGENNFKFEKGIEYIIKNFEKIILINCLVNYKFVREQKPELFLNFFETIELNGIKLDKNFIQEVESKFRSRQKLFDEEYKTNSLKDYELILKGKKSKDKR